MRRPSMHFELDDEERRLMVVLVKNLPITRHLTIPKKRKKLVFEMLSVEGSTNTPYGGNSKNG